MKMVFFDADDTLWDIITHYSDAMADAATKMSNDFNLPYDYIYDKIYKKNIETAKEIGHIRSQFPAAITKVFADLCKEKCIEIDTDSVLDTYISTDKVYDQAPEVKPGVKSTICALNRSGYVCKIVTLGDEVMQSAKIYRSGIWEYIRDAFILPVKDKEAYKDIANRFPDNDKFIMVGNSIRNDINPALEAGWYAIHIPVDTWELEHAKIIEHEDGKFFTVENIKDVAGVVDSIYEGTERK